MQEKILEDFRKDLKKNVDQKAKDGFQRYFKEKVKFYGLKTSNVSKISKKYFKLIQPEGKKAVFAYCEELFKSGFCEEAWIAADWTYSFRKEFEKKDFKLFETWIEKYIDNWAECDTFCNHTVGEIIEQNPEFINTLKVWAKSKNRWMKRASAVSLIVPGRKGMFLEDIFEIADILLKDTDDMVQKGYGWMLKVAANKHQKEVFDYVVENKAVMPRTALRYAIEKMPQSLRKKAMAK